MAHPADKRDTDLDNYKLPCSVTLEDGLVLRAGVSMRTLMLALRRREPQNLSLAQANLLMLDGRSFALHVSGDPDKEPSK